METEGSKESFENKNQSKKEWETAFDSSVSQED